MSCALLSGPVGYPQADFPDTEPLEGAIYAGMLECFSGESEVWLMYAKRGILRMQRSQERGALISAEAVGVATALASVTRPAITPCLAICFPLFAIDNL